MSTSLSPLIRPKDIQFGKGIIIIDARSGPDAFDRFRAGHLEGALHADLDRDLSSKPKDAAQGGRHPLPDVTAFATFVGKLGITPSTHVVVYDDKSGANAAARFWWMLRALGHEKIQVVDGGLDAMIREGMPMVSAKKSVKQEPISCPPYPAEGWTLPTVTIDEVQKAASDPDALVIDVREAYRYRGEREPIDQVAGHIPGAINIPYLNNLTVSGNFRSADDLASLYEQVLGRREPSNVIVHCGSGVTACHTLLALEYAGIKNANLYVGSWSEWSRRDLPVAKDGV
jgi:thiosulfate/3-mercaptopyruvate sulfurtransferase